MPHIILRDVIESDLPVFFEQQLDPAAAAMAAFPSRERGSFMTHWYRIMQNENVILKTILCDGKVAGNIVSWQQEDECEVGYWLGKEYWGKGIATRALAQFLDLVKIRPLHAYVAKHNAASLRVLQKCGFVIQADGDSVENMIKLTLENAEQNPA